MFRCGLVHLYGRFFISLMAEGAIDVIRMTEEHRQLMYWSPGYFWPVGSQHEQHDIRSDVHFLPAVSGVATGQNLLSML